MVVKFSLQYTSNGDTITKDVCCLRNRKYEKDEDYIFLSGKSDTYLIKKKKDTSSSKITNCLLSTVYISSSIITIIIVATLPVTIILSSITGLGLSIYYIYSAREDLKKIDTKNF